MADENENNTPAVDSTAAPISALSQAVSKDKKKKKRKKKVSKKKRALVNKKELFFFLIL